MPCPQASRSSGRSTSCCRSWTRALRTDDRAMALLRGGFARRRPAIALTDAVAGWRADPRTEGLRWVPPEALHLTLAFLGPVEPDQVSEIGHRIAGVADTHAPMTRSTGASAPLRAPAARRYCGTGSPIPMADFPRWRKTSLRLCGSRRPSRIGPMSRWRVPAAVRSTCAADRGRVRVGARRHVAVDELRLMRSHLGSGPARYETLASFPLGRTDG